MYFAIQSWSFGRNASLQRYPAFRVEVRSTFTTTDWEDQSRRFWKICSNPRNFKIPWLTVGWKRRPPLVNLPESWIEHGNHGYLDVSLHGQPKEHGKKSRVQGSVIRAQDVFCMYLMFSKTGSRCWGTLQQLAKFCFSERCELSVVQSALDIFFTTVVMLILA